jgi:hypothetical protein
MKYFLTQDGLGWKNPDGIILICMNKDESDQLIKESIQDIALVTLLPAPPLIIL